VLKTAVCSNSMAGTVHEKAWLQEMRRTSVIAASRLTGEIADTFFFKYCSVQQQHGWQVHEKA
jgi:hypothetical protein